MTHSIRRQLALIFIGLMAGTIFLCWLMNNLFLGQYYIRSRTEVIYEAYHKIQQAANSDTYSTEAFRKELNDVCGIYNITVYVMDANSRLKYASINGGEELEKRLTAYIFGFFTDEVEIIEEGDGYVVQQLHTEGKDFLEMYGRLSTGISFIMHTPLESIRESAKIANRFLAYMGIVAALAGGIIVLFVCTKITKPILGLGIVAALAGGVIVWFVSTKITKPILELNRISEKMVHLDFEAKYEGGASNEIGLLGENINKLSASLERSISELKTANNELQKDIERKEQIDAMRREFLANVSHELKTPIALIQGYAEGLSEGVNDDPESRSFYCEVIMDEAAKMNNMVKKLMTLNQLEFGNDVVAMERFDVTALIKNYVQSAGILTRQNEITVRMAEYEPAYVWGDVYKTEEVFMNYFSNAVNHCQIMDIRNGKIIVISLEQREGNIRIGVFNTGKPIPEEMIVLPFRSAVTVPF